MADFTLGDLWGQWPGLITKQDKKYGMSALLVNTPKGKAVFEKLQSVLICQPVEAERVAKFNSALNKSTVAHPKRGEFFNRYQTEKFTLLVRELLSIRPIYIALPGILLKKLFRKIKFR